MKVELFIKDYKQAISQLVEALQIPAEHDVIRAGCIQYFEFTFELAWKSIKVVAQQQGLNPTGSPKSSLKLAFSQDWIKEEIIWLEMLDSRNRMSHTYEAKDALTIYERLPFFVEPLSELLESLERQIA
jgi:nucleotidyltransferase substrate binding protein (TIGR01987 family)